MFCNFQENFSNRKRVFFFLQILRSDCTNTYVVFNSVFAICVVIELHNIRTSCIYVSDNVQFGRATPTTGFYVLFENIQFPFPMKNCFINYLCSLCSNLFILQSLFPSNLNIPSAKVHLHKDMM